MKRISYSLKTAYLATGIFMLLLLVLQFAILKMNNAKEAQFTMDAYLSEVETILAKNVLQEKTLASSLKEEYTIHAKAVAHYLSNNEEAIGKPEELKKICSLLSIDEIHIFDETGTIFSSSDPIYIGYSFDSGQQIGYFMPMLSDRSLTMCQDPTPNTAEGKSMIYAITWNEAQTFMVQVGIKPLPLLETLASNEIPNVVSNIALTDDMGLIIASTDGETIYGATNPDFTDKSIAQVSDIVPVPMENGSQKFIRTCHLKTLPTPLYCTVKGRDNYSIYIFMNHRSFWVRDLESLTFVVLYLLLAYFIITFILKRLIFVRQESTQHAEVLQSMTEIYYSLHLVDLKDQTMVVYSAKNQVKESARHAEGAKPSEVMVKIMHATMSDEYLERGLEFTDLTTLPERMKGKKSISMELLGKNVGWIRMSFITITEHEGIPERIVVATQIIDEEKKAAQSLYEKSHRDELTKCYNRRAYNSDLPSCLENSQDTPFVYVSLDLNGLKTVNDQQGHEAGDELIRGAAECMNKVFGTYGKIYRMGGDEFAALLMVDAEIMEALSRKFEREMEEWHGRLVSSLSISYGYVLSSEAEGLTLEELSALADKRMYECKQRYYQEKGISQRRT